MPRQQAGQSIPDGRGSLACASFLPDPLLSVEKVPDISLLCHVFLMLLHYQRPLPRIYSYFWKRSTVRRGGCCVRRIVRRCASASQISADDEGDTPEPAERNNHQSCD